MPVTQEVWWRDVLVEVPPDDASVIIVARDTKDSNKELSPFEARFWSFPGREVTDGTGWSAQDGCPLYDLRVTHWMPMPKPPTTEKT